MRQAQITAAVAMAYATGIRSKAWGLADKVEGSHNGLKDAIRQYVEPAQAMYELGEEMAASLPDNFEHAVYDRVAAKFCEYLREQGKLPTPAEFFPIMREAVNYYFEDHLTHEMRPVFLRKLEGIEPEDE